VGIDTLGLFIRESGNGGVKLLQRNLSLIDFPRGNGGKDSVVLNTVPSIQ